MRFEPEQVRIGLGGPAGADQAKMRDEVAAGPDEGLEQAVFDGGQVEACLLYTSDAADE